jgi:hypothetical protein
MTPAMAAAVTDHLWTTNELFSAGCSLFEMTKTQKCRHCGSEFQPGPQKPGYIDECPSCLAAMHEVEVQRADNRWLRGYRPKPKNENWELVKVLFWVVLIIAWFVLAIVTAFRK